MLLSGGTIRALINLVPKGINLGHGSKVQWKLVRASCGKILSEAEVKKISSLESSLRIAAARCSVLRFSVAGLSPTDFAGTDETKSSGWKKVGLIASSFLMASIFASKERVSADAKPLTAVPHIDLSDAIQKGFLLYGQMQVLSGMLQQVTAQLHSEGSLPEEQQLAALLVQVENTSKKMQGRLDHLLDNVAANIQLMEKDINENGLEDFVLLLGLFEADLKIVGLSFSSSLESLQDVEQVFKDLHLETERALSRADNEQFHAQLFTGLTGFVTIAGVITFYYVPEAWVALGTALSGTAMVTGAMICESLRRKKALIDDFLTKLSKHKIDLKVTLAGYSANKTDLAAIDAQMKALSPLHSKQVLATKVLKSMQACLALRKQSD